MRPRYTLPLKPATRSTLFPYTTLFRSRWRRRTWRRRCRPGWRGTGCRSRRTHRSTRSEEHTSELQSRREIVCRLLLENTKDPTVETGQKVADDEGGLGEYAGKIKELLG